MKKQWLFFLSILSVCVVVLGSCGGGGLEVLEFSGETHTMQYTPVWNVAEGSFEEWQQMNLPRQILPISNHDLIISDANNGRVLWITTGGELIRQIGEWGSKPGQFTHPGDLAVDREDGSVVQITDRIQGQIGRFRLNERAASYIGGYTLPFVSGGHWTYGMVMNDGGTSWFALPRGDYRLALVDSVGRIVKTAYPRRLSGTLSLRTIPRSDILYLADLGGGRMITALTARPEVSIWSKQGELLRRTTLRVPEIAAFEEERARDGSEKFYIQAVGVSPRGSASSFFILVGHSRPELVIYELSAESLEPLRRYVARVPRGALVMSIAPITRGGGLEFFCIDAKNGELGLLQDAKAFTR